MTTSSHNHVTATESDGGPPPAPVDIGWIVSDRLDPLDQRAINEARTRVLSFLNEHLPGFDWRVILQTRELISDTGEGEPVEFMDRAVAERDIRRWDYVFVFVDVDLVARQGTKSWAAVCRTLDSAVISTARIDPRADDADAGDELRVRAIAHRVSLLVLRSVGHLNGLDSTDAAGNLMRSWDQPAELDEPHDFEEGQLRQIAENLRRIADPRLEEETKRTSRWLFAFQAAWRNRVEIWQGVRQARPWQMPVRLTRLTIAAVSTVLVLLMSAEAWELGASQSAFVVAALSITTMIVTTVHVLRRQRLLVSLPGDRLREQTVTSNATTVAVVSIGIVTVYVCLFALTLLLSGLLFRPALVASWSSIPESELSLTHYLVFSAFVSAIGNLIGALGATFEGQNYFRHITFVDEEV